MTALPPPTTTSPIDLADLVLRRLVTEPPCSVTVEPLDGARAHVIRIDEGEGYVTKASLPPALGNALAARLAIIADLELDTTTAQLGRARVALREPESGPSTAPADIVVAIRTANGALSAELFRTASSIPPRSAPPSTAGLGESDEQLGRYRLKRELGRGGMGVVYLGEHVVLQKEVAIKVLHTSATQNPMLAAQFVVEGRAACRARHPGIVDVTDFGTLPDGRAYIAMELVDGPTLSAVLEKEGPLPPLRILALTARIAEALSAASQSGVVHRDLTPSNIFVCEGDRTKIGDFGVAKLVDKEAAVPASRPKAEPVVGTAGYMSPEQGLGEPVDARSDIYSLGCVMYRMVTGKVPFTGNSLYTVLLKHMNEPPPPMESPHGALPKPLEAIILRALAKSKADRFQTAAELLQEVERARPLLEALATIDGDPRP